MKIAYLEDDVESATTVCAWLRDAEYDVEWFSSGEKCARSVANEHFDVCLFDWNVPDLPGIEVLARLKIQLRQAMPPVIFATGRDAEQDVVAVVVVQGGRRAESGAACRGRRAGRASSAGAVP